MMRAHQETLSAADGAAAATAAALHPYITETLPEPEHTLGQTLQRFFYRGGSASELRELVKLAADRLELMQLHVDELFAILDSEKAGKGRKLKQIERQLLEAEDDLMASALGGKVNTAPSIWAGMPAQRDEGAPAGDAPTLRLAPLTWEEGDGGATYRATDPMTGFSWLILKDPQNGLWQMHGGTPPGASTWAGPNAAAEGCERIRAHQFAAKFPGLEVMK
jgi:hypothetical protein